MSSSARIDSSRPTRVGDAVRGGVLMEAHTLESLIIDVRFSTISRRRRCGGFSQPGLRFHQGGRILRWYYSNQFPAGVIGRPE